MRHLDLLENSVGTIGQNNWLESKDIFISSIHIISKIFVQLSQIIVSDLSSKVMNLLTIALIEPYCIKVLDGRAKAIQIKAPFKKYSNS